MPQFEEYRGRLHDLMTMVVNHCFHAAAIEILREMVYRIAPTVTEGVSDESDGNNVATYDQFQREQIEDLAEMVTVCVRAYEARCEEATCKLADPSIFATDPWEITQELRASIISERFDDIAHQLTIAASREGWDV